LTSLRTNLDLLAQADARGGLSPDARRELMDDVQFQIEELTTLIGDLTELAREESMPARLEPLDLADVVARALQRVRRRAPVDPGLEFDVELGSWPVIGEQTSLERAVTNVLDNAVKWSPPGGVVTVRLGGTAAEVDGSGAPRSPAGPEAVQPGTLYVADQGPGISPDDLPHVFERFYRSTESRTMPGSGLGLAIVRSIAERHGGQVAAGTAPGGGAAVWLRIPGVPAAAGAIPVEVTHI
jgi:two-component system, OmpR family, sensor histidine kinase MprB